MLLAFIRNIFTSMINTCTVECRLQMIWLFHKGTNTNSRKNVEESCDSVI